MRGELQVVADPQQHGGIVSLAHLAGTLHDRLKRRSDFSGRGCNDPENAAAGSLIGQSFLQIARLGLHLVEKSCVLNSNQSLISESLYQLKLTRPEFLG